MIYQSNACVLCCQAGFYRQDIF